MMHKQWAKLEAGGGCIMHYNNVKHSISMHVLNVYMKLKGGTFAPGLDVTPKFHPPKLMVAVPTGSHLQPDATLQVSKRHRGRPPHSLFLMEATSSCTEQIEPNRKSGTRWNGESVPFQIKTVGHVTSDVSQEISPRLYFYDFFIRWKKTLFTLSSVTTHLW